MLFIKELQIQFAALFHLIKIIINLFGRLKKYLDICLNI